MSRRMLGWAEQYCQQRFMAAQVSETSTCDIRNVCNSGTGSAGYRGAASAVAIKRRPSSRVRAHLGRPTVNGPLGTKGV